jgi:hypothetical protein
MELKKGRPKGANFAKKQVSQDVLPKKLEAKVEEGNESHPNENTNPLSLPLA